MKWDWLNGGVFAVTLLTLFFSYLRHPPLTTSSKLEALRKEIDGLRAENRDCQDTNDRHEALIKELEQQIRELRAQVAFWQDEWRALRAGKV